MAWEISMSQQGWSNVYENICDTDKQDLIGALIDDKIEQAEHDEDFTFSPEAEEKYSQELEQLTQDVLADMVYEMCQKHNTCENGGFEVYLDREGHHTIPTTRNPDGWGVIEC